MKNLLFGVFWFILLNCLCPISFGQNLTSQADSLIALKIPNRITRDPQELANALTAGKTSDKEKLDAIFAWVVNKIAYEPRKTITRGVPDQYPIRKILNRRAGRPSDLAKLMDTLCHFAGIFNTSIPGYIKEINFDINDSIYFDRHVWNAVKLEGYWYLYDVPFTSGRMVFDLTRFGHWRANLMRKLSRKTVRKSYVYQSTYRGNRFCGDFPKTEKKKYDYDQIRFFPRLIIKIDNMFPYRFKLKYQKVRNTKYYLANPEVFALDHFPNIEKWSLSTEIQTLNDFRSDSSHYYTSANPYVKIESNGRSCILCEQPFYLDPIPKEKHVKAKTLACNTINALAQSGSSFKIAYLFSLEALKAKDSLSKMNYIDSTLIYLDSCNQELSKSLRAKNKSFNFHQKKNQAKHKLCLEDNRQLSTDIRKEFKSNDKQHIKIKSLNNKSAIQSKAGRKNHERFKKNLHKIYTYKKLKEQQLNKIKHDLELANSMSDSLSKIIDEKQIDFQVNGNDLWMNILNVLEDLDPLESSLYLDGAWRSPNLLDHYDEEVVLARRDIRIHKNNFIIGSQNRVIRLSELTYQDFITLSNLVKKRNTSLLKSAKLMARLKASKEISNESISIFEAENTKLIEKDVCWYYEHRDLIGSLVANFKRFESQKSSFEKALRYVDKKERNRNRFIEKYNEKFKKSTDEEITRSKRNLFLLKKRIYDHRNDFLQKLRKERKKSRKK